MIEIKTERLLLRDWRDEDLPAWTAINADPEVREYLGPVWDEAQSAASMVKYQEAYQRNGFSFWAVESLATGELLGLAGLDPVEPEVPFDGIEIGWRLARSAWGKGYASEAALAALDFGFRTAGLAEIFAITLAGNVRSQAVMTRVGMTHVPERDFVYHETPGDEGYQHVVWSKKAA
ncbi:GNAT family N-acetyltransferase [Longispora albida]|uniref:GNAT family N-acetyltransferase n=1 Tax=Longispora albida TaxID=203523 RepID=UPI00039FD7DB|nr:GNAT family N-acetyltransferase [Longispora albida]